MADLISDFTLRMDSLGPFEEFPYIAVAVSGGADSLALTFLANHWARKRHGKVLALNVDHGLRKESAIEALQTSQWLARENIASHVLRWTEKKPITGVQATARKARYRLLKEACRKEGILHLLLAHHRDDQAETLALRYYSNSGAKGLACMSSVVENADVRLLRPLLNIPHEALVNYLKAQGQPWIEDPSNRDKRYTRACIRHELVNQDRAHLAAYAKCFGKIRQASEDLETTLLIRCCRLFPQGYAQLDLKTWRQFNRDNRRALLSRLLTMVGGNIYPPRSKRLARLEEKLNTENAISHGATLAGCRLLPDQKGLLICREIRDPSALQLSVKAGRIVWDRRFVIDIVGKGEGWLAPLGSGTEYKLFEDKIGSKKSTLPPAVRMGLPVLWDATGPRRIPYIDYMQEKGNKSDSRIDIRDIVFCPPISLSGIGFALA